MLDGLVLTGPRRPLLVRRLAALVPAAMVLAGGVGEIEALLWTQVVLSVALLLVVVNVAGLLGLLL